MYIYLFFKPFENVGPWFAYFANLVPLRSKEAKACFKNKYYNTNLNVSFSKKELLLGALLKQNKKYYFFNVTTTRRNGSSPSE